MPNLTKAALWAALPFCLFVATPAAAQSAAPESVVSIYHAAPGHQEELIRWLADRDRISAAAGIAPSQLYVHMDGDSWDFVLISPATSRAQDDAADAAAKKMGLTSGPRAGLELRKHIMSHTDTFAMGPITPAQYLQRIGSK